MGGRIDCYVDIASFYSYIAFADLLPNLGKLAANGVEVEFHPVLIGAINVMSGNKPPWTVKAKAKYLNRDSIRAAERVSKPNITFPKNKDFNTMSMTISPLRALHFIKANYPTPVFISAFHYMFEQYWTPPHVNLTEDDKLEETLAQATETPEGGKKLFTEDDVKKIMEGRKEMKDKVKDVTGEAAEKGAFGAPWLWVTNDEGNGEAFFGSDRFNHIYEYLGVHFQDVAVLPPSKL